MPSKITVMVIINNRRRLLVILVSILDVNHFLLFRPVQGIMQQCVIWLDTTHSGWPTLFVGCCFLFGFLAWLKVRVETPQYFKLADFAGASSLKRHQIKVHLFRLNNNNNNKRFLYPDAYKKLISAVWQPASTQALYTGE